MRIAVRLENNRQVAVKDGNLPGEISLYGLSGSVPFTAEDARRVSALFDAVAVKLSESDERTGERAVELSTRERKEQCSPQ